MRKWSDICAYRCVIHITGWEVERFLNICKHNDILFTDVIMDKTGVFATISYKAWKTVQKLQEKCQVSCSIVTETGLYPFLRKYKKRVAFVVSLMVCAGIVFLFISFLSGI